MGRLLQFTPPARHRQSDALQSETPAATLGVQGQRRCRRLNSGPQLNLWRGVRRPGIFLVIACQDCIHLLPDQTQKSGDIKPVTLRRKGREIFFRQPKQAHRRIQPPPVFWMRGSRVLFLQMHKPSRRLDQALEIIRVVRFRPQPKVLEDVVGFVVTLLIPAPEKPPVAGMLRDLVIRARDRRAAQLLDQLGNSLAFVHGTLSFVSAVMTGNRIPILFPREGCCVDGRG